MTIHIALLRGINVGGHRKVAMSDLRDLLADLGFTNAQSLLQSGNLVFDSGPKRGAKLEQLLATAAAEHLDLETTFFVRTAAEWEELISDNPFPAEAARDPAHLVAMCLRDEPDAKDVRALQAAIPGRETIQYRGRHLYLVYPDGIGDSKCTNTFIERRLGIAGTARNWNTVRKLGALVGM